MPDVVHVRGLALELDEPAGPGASIASEDAKKDATGVGLLWEAATNMLCDYLETCMCESLRAADSVLELGAGLGVPGMLCATLGAPRVVLSDYHPLVLARLVSNVRRNAAASVCTVEDLAWGTPAAATPHHQLLIGADLGVSERAASLLAATVRAHMAPGGVFLYAHQERRAVTRGADGCISREVRLAAGRLVGQAC